MTHSDPLRARYEHFVHAHAAELHRFAYRLTGRADVSQDLVQETFLEAWRSIGQLKTSEKGRAWLFSILRHRWAHLRRDASRRITTLSTTETLGIYPSDAVLPIEMLAQEETLQNALNSLDPRFKEAFLMVYMQGLTCKEAAAELGVPLGTVLSRMSRGGNRCEPLWLPSKVAAVAPQSGEREAEK